MTVRELKDKLNTIPEDADILIRLVSFDELDIDTRNSDVEGFIDFGPDAYVAEDNICAIDIVIQGEHCYSFVDKTDDVKRFYKRLYKENTKTKGGLNAK